MCGRKVTPITQKLSGQVNEAHFGMAHSADKRMNAIGIVAFWVRSQVMLALQASQVSASKHFVLATNY